MIDGGGRGVAASAIVHSVDGVRLVITGSTRQAVIARVADYVRDRCGDVLWPAAASGVRAMLDAGNLSGAISLYFERVGERWDEERLELEAVEFDGADAISHDKPMANAP